MSQDYCRNSPKLYKYILNYIFIFSDGGVRYDPSGEYDDNSYYNTANGELTFGIGGVDDGEDADVIIHELGHGIHDWSCGGDYSTAEGLSEVSVTSLIFTFLEERDLCHFS